MTATRGSALTAAIWREPPRVRVQRVRRVCDALRATYGCPRLGNPRSPLDDLVYIILSNKTAPEVAKRVFRTVKRRFGSWDDLLRSRPSILRRLLLPAGLATVKSDQIRRALRRIAQDFGRCSLRPLRRRPERDIHQYLTSLPGISEKVSKCVMMYTMGAQVLPVDAHVHRIAVRLGWTIRKRADQCHDELEALVAPRHRHAFHVDCIVHGRQVCRPTDPLCAVCCIARWCDFRQGQCDAPDR